MQLSTNQRIAIKRMLLSLYVNTITTKWDERILRYFSDYDLPLEENIIPTSIDIEQLKALPHKIKRDIILRIFNAWSAICGCHSRSIFMAYCTLIRWGMCSETEYLFMSTLESLLRYFGTSMLWGEAADIHFELNYNDPETSIQFNLDDRAKKMQILISGTLIDRITPFEDYPTQDQIQSLFDVIRCRPFRSHAPWISVDADIDCRYSYYGYKKGIVEFNLRNIEFID